MRAFGDVRRRALVVVEFGDLVPRKRAGGSRCLGHDEAGRTRMGDAPRTRVTMRVVVDLCRHAVDGAHGDPFPITDICSRTPRVGQCGENRR